MKLYISYFELRVFKTPSAVGYRPVTCMVGSKFVS
jgi:hypothetical protein